MPLVEFTDSDLLRNKIISPSWYRVELTTVSEWTPSKAGTSNNCTIEGTVVMNADTGDKEFAGVPISILFNDSPKARGFIEGFFRGLGEDVQPGRYDLKVAAGKSIDCFVENETYEGRVRNRINHKYRACRS